MAQLGDLIVSGKARFLNEINGQIDWSNVLSKPTIPTVTDTYSATGTAATSGKAVAAALGTLDGSITGTAGASKTLTAFSQTDGKVSATFANISITKSQVSDFPTSMTPTSHTHGNIQNGGTLQTNDVTIADGDKLVVTDRSDSAKIARTSISFDGSTTTQCLTKKGEWATFGTSNLVIGTTATTAMAGNTTVDNAYQIATSTNGNYELLFSGTADNTTRAESVRKTQYCVCNPYEKQITIRNASDSKNYIQIRSNSGYSAKSSIQLSASGSSETTQADSMTIMCSNTASYTDIQLGTTTWDGTNTSLKTAVTSAKDTVKQTASDSAADYYELLFSSTADNTTRTESTRKTQSLLYSPSSKELRITNSDNSSMTKVTNGNLEVKYTGSTNIPARAELSLSAAVVGDGFTGTVELYDTTGKSMMVGSKDIFLSGTGNTWDGTETYLKSAIGKYITVTTNVNIDNYREYKGVYLITGAAVTAGTTTLPVTTGGKLIVDTWKETKNNTTYTYAMQEYEPWGSSSTDNLTNIYRRTYDAVAGTWSSWYKPAPGGTFWTKGWTATSTAAVNAKLTESVDISPGNYILIGSAPGNVSAEIPIAVTTNANLNIFPLYANIRTRSHFIFHIQATASVSNVYLKTAASASVTYSNVDQGGFRLIKLS